mgnify:CR=1 FL=1
MSARRARLTSTSASMTSEASVLIPSVDEGAECRDVVTQLSAAKAALDRVGFTLLSSALRQCAVDGEDTDELERLFLKLS